jgi:hypothetical protein
VVKKFLKVSFKVFTIAGGRSAHCQGDNRIVGSNFVADRVADSL